MSAWKVVIATLGEILKLQGTLSYEGLFHIPVIFFFPSLLTFEAHTVRKRKKVRNVKCLQLALGLCLSSPGPTIGCQRSADGRGRGGDRCRRLTDAGLVGGGVWGTFLWVANRCTSYSLPSLPPSATAIENDSFEVLPLAYFWTGTGPPEK